MDRALDIVLLACLLALAALGLARGAGLYRRGVAVIAIDRERTPLQALFDLAFVLCWLLWWLEAAAAALGGSGLLPASLHGVLFRAAAVHWAGVALMLSGLVAYGLALRAFGDSWRLGLDRKQPGALVTGGIFSRSRNPVYLGLDLLAVGAFLATGRLSLGLLAVVVVAGLHYQILREEPFLAETYGDAYRDYRARVARYWTLA